MVQSFQFDDKIVDGMDEGGPWPNKNSGYSTVRSHLQGALLEVAASSYGGELKGEGEQVQLDVSGLYTCHMSDKFRNDLKKEYFEHLVLAVIETLIGGGARVQPLVFDKESEQLCVNMKRFFESHNLGERFEYTYYDVEPDVNRERAMQQHWLQLGDKIVNHFEQKSADPVVFWGFRCMLERLYKAHQGKRRDIQAFVEKKVEDYFASRSNDQEGGLLFELVSYQTTTDDFKRKVPGKEHIKIFHLLEERTADETITSAPDVQDTTESQFHAEPDPLPEKQPVVGEGDRLKIGTEIVTGSENGTITGVLSEIKEKVCYTASLSSEDVVVCWFSKGDGEQRALFERQVSLGPPSRQFIWPMELATRPEAPSSRAFGFVAPVISEDYKAINRLPVGSLAISFRGLIHAGVLLADSFYRLHEQGFCFKDLADTDVLLNDEEQLLIKGTDNVTSRGHEKKYPGTMRFMAPERVRAEKGPDEYTDRFLLGVLLFYMLYTHHPLEGEVRTKILEFNQAARAKIYGEEPIYIFDEENSSNRPVRGLPGHQNAIDYHKVYPQYLKAYFHDHFTYGLKEPNRRIESIKWRGALIKLRDSVFTCNKCNEAMVFYDRTVLVNTGQLTGCWKCGNMPDMPPRMKLPGGDILILDVGARIYMNHLEETRADFETVIGEVSRNPSNPSDTGLTNKTGQNWELIYSTGDTKNLEPGRTIRLQNGLKIIIDGREFTVRIG